MPKTYKTEIIGYTFSELNEEVKREVYENDNEFSYSVDLDPVEMSFREALVSNFGADPKSLKVYYDLSYSQGSGACCTGELDVKTVLENRLGSYFANLAKLIDLGAVTIDEINIVRCGPSNFYSHENTCQVEIEYSCDSSKVGSWDGDEVTELEEMLTNSIREELCTFYSIMQDYYETASSFDAYCEFMEGASAIFTEDGNVVDPVFIKNAFVIDGYQLALDFEE